MYMARMSRRAAGHSYGQRILFLNFLELLLDLNILEIAPRALAASVWSPALLYKFQKYFLNVARSGYLLSRASETLAAP